MVWVSKVFLKEASKVNHPHTAKATKVEKALQNKGFPSFSTLKLV